MRGKFKVIVRLANGHWMTYTGTNVEVNRDGFLCIRTSQITSKILEPDTWVSYQVE